MNEYINSHVLCIMSSLMTSMQFVCKDENSSRCTYEAHAFEKVPDTTSKRELLRLVSAWVQEHSLLHEHSTFVADSIRQCASDGAFATPRQPVLLAMRSAADTQQLSLAVQTHAGHGPCEVSFGTLEIATALEPATEACPAYTFSQHSSSLKTSVQGFRVLCTRDASQIEITGYMFPVLRRATFSQSFLQQGATSQTMQKCTRITPESQAGSLTLCRSHRDYRIKCRQVHEHDRATVSFCDRDVFAHLTTLTHDISVLSTRANVGNTSAAVHTVVFKC